MRKEFSAKNYFAFSIRYFVVVIVLALVGMCAGLVYGMSNNSSETVRFEGNLALVGISEFYGADPTEGQAAAYERMRENVLDAMIARELKAKLYGEVSEEWKLITGMENDKAAQKNFFKCFSAWRDSFYIYVEMSIGHENSEKAEKRAQSDAFSIKVIDRYLDMAVENAYRIEAIVGDNDRIIVTRAHSALPEIKDSMGLLRSIFIGFAGGFVVGLVVMLLIYIFDGRILAYGDIASLTGKKLLGVNDSDGSGSLYPNVDCEADGESLLVCGGERICRKIAEGYVRYAVGTGKSVLLIDCDNAGDVRGDGLDGLGEYMAGEPLGKCMKIEDGIDVLYGGNSWQSTLSNCDKLASRVLGYDMVVFSAPFRGDGRLNVLSRVCGKIMVAVDQKGMRMRDVLTMMHETQFSDKVIGAAIENTGKSFVGGKVYVAPAEEE